MGRVVKDARLDSREARLKLSISHEQYWRLIHEGLHLVTEKGRVAAFGICGFSMNQLSITLKKL